MSLYQLNTSFKTKFLNLFRKLFTTSIIDGFIASNYIKKHSVLLEKLIPPPYLYKKNSWRKVNRDGIYYNLDISDVVDHYVYFGYKEKSFDYIVNYLKEANVILDIGANIGWTAMVFAKYAPNAKIIAFEPHPKTYQKAIENLSYNSFKNIELLNLGLGLEKSTLKLYQVDQSNSGMNRILTSDVPFDFIEVNVDKLDDLLLSKGVDKVDFIKLDVEGFEYSVILGGTEILKKSTPPILLELDNQYLIENGSSARIMINTLKNLGYNNFLRIDNGTIVDDSTDLSYCHFDMLCTKK